MLIKRRERELSPKNQKTYKQRKFRFPVDLHLKQAVGALTLHTGVGTIWITDGHKKCQRQSVGELLVACFKWRSVQRWRFILE